VRKGRKKNKRVREKGKEEEKTKRILEEALGSERFITEAGKKKRLGAA